MAETTTGLLRSLVWVPTTEYQLDTEVGEAIASYCAENGRECPADELFQCAAWAVPSGTELTSREDLDLYGDSRAPAPALRVTLGGEQFALSVDWSGGCGCEECGGQPNLAVVEVCRV